MSSWYYPWQVNPVIGRLEEMPCAFAQSTHSWASYIKGEYDHKAAPELYPYDAKVFITVSGEALPAIMYWEKALERYKEKLNKGLNESFEDTDSINDILTLQEGYVNDRYLARIRSIKNFPGIEEVEIHA